LKAFLLAAGNGTRLRPLTDNVPKCLLPIRGVPMLQIWLQVCKRFRIDEVLVNAHAHVESIRHYLRQHANGIRVRLAEEPELLGSAGTLRAHRNWVAAEQCFWVFYADVLNRANLANMLELQQRRKPAATLGVYPVSDPTRCGIVNVNDSGVITEFVEKPKNPTSTLAFSGLMVATPELLDAIPDSIPADIGFHVLPRLVGRILAFPINDYLIDIGTLENYQVAQTTWTGLHEDRAVITVKRSF
jgi:mannose-1-phosphate guanylyltransferase